MVLDPNGDVAHVKWGNNWHMPTATEQLELINKCTWEKFILNDVYGHKVTGPNGNSIFLQGAYNRCCGNYYDEYYVSNSYCYWSSSLSANGNNCADILCSLLGYYNELSSAPCCFGITVRPVSE